MSSLESPTFPPATLLENEEWRPVVGYEGVYSVSNYSRVYVHPRKANGRNGGVRLLKGRILRPTTDKKNHWYVGLTKDSKVKYKYIHRLSLEAFVGPPPAEASECCHGDDDPNNNHISNLRWGTRSDNANDMMKNGKFPPLEATTCKNGHRRGGNNVPSRYNGTRRKPCLACERARAYLQSRKPYTYEEFLSVANSYYEELVNKAREELDN